MIAKIQEIFRKIRLLKNKAAQAMIEFVMILPLLIMILLGTYDIFNVSVSYLQMTFLGNTFLGASLMNQQLGSYDFRDPSRVASNVHNIINRHEKDSKGFPLYFFFGQGPNHRNKDFEFCAEYDSTSSRTMHDAVGTIHCIVVKHNIDLVTGKIMFPNNKNSQITLVKKVCGVQEKTFAPNGGRPTLPTWPSCRDMPK